MSGAGCPASCKTLRTVLANPVSVQPMACSQCLRSVEPVPVPVQGPGVGPSQPSGGNPTRQLDTRPSLAHIQGLFDSFGRDGASAAGAGEQAFPAGNNAFARSRGAASGGTHTDDSIPAADRRSAMSPVVGSAVSPGMESRQDDGAAATGSIQRLYRVSNVFALAGATTMLPCCPLDG